MAHAPRHKAGEFAISLFWREIVRFKSGMSGVTTLGVQERRCIRVRDCSCVFALHPWRAAVVAIFLLVVVPNARVYMCACAFVCFARGFKKRGDCARWCATFVRPHDVA